MACDNSFIGGEEVCPVCLEKMSENGNSTLPCGHCFHTMCVIQAYTHTPSCPMCRGSSLPPPRPSQALSSQRLGVGIDLVVPDVSDSNRREYRSYLQKKYRLERRDERARNNRDRVVDAKKRVKETRSRCEARAKELNEILSKDEELASLCSEHSKAKRTLSRLSKNKDAYIREKIGVAPEPTVQAVEERQSRIASLIRDALNTAFRSLDGEVQEEETQ